MKARYKVPVVLLAGLTAAGFVAYRVLLTESAKESMRAGVNTARRACEEILDVVSTSQGSVVEEDMLPNRVRTEEQWEALGI